MRLLPQETPVVDHQDSLILLLIVYECGAFARASVMRSVRRSSPMRRPAARSSFLPSLTISLSSDEHVEIDNRRHTARRTQNCRENPLLAAQIFHAQLLQIFAVFYFVDPGEKRFFEFGNGSPAARQPDYVRPNLSSKRNPVPPATSEPAKMPSFAISSSGCPAKARLAMKIDIVKPIPPMAPTPRI